MSLERLAGRVPDWLLRRWHALTAASPLPATASTADIARAWVEGAALEDLLGRLGIAAPRWLPSVVPFERAFERFRLTPNEALDALRRFTRGTAAPEQLEFPFARQTARLGWSPDEARRWLTDFLARRERLAERLAPPPSEGQLVLLPEVVRLPYVRPAESGPSAAAAAERLVADAQARLEQLRPDLYARTPSVVGTGYAARPPRILEEVLTQGAPEGVYRPSLRALSDLVYGASTPPEAGAAALAALAASAARTRGIPLAAPAQKFLQSSVGKTLGELLSWPGGAYVYTALRSLGRPVGESARLAASLLAMMQQAQRTGLAAVPRPLRPAMAARYEALAPSVVLERFLGGMPAGTRVVRTVFEIPDDVLRGLGPTFGPEEAAAAMGLELGLGKPVAVRGRKLVWEIAEPQIPALTKWLRTGPLPDLRRAESAQLGPKMPPFPLDVDAWLRLAPSLPAALNQMRAAAARSTAAGTRRVAPVELPQAMAQDARWLGRTMFAQEGPLVPRQTPSGPAREASRLAQAFYVREGRLPSLDELERVVRHHQATGKLVTPADGPAWEALAPAAPGRPRERTALQEGLQLAHRAVAPLLEPPPVTGQRVALTRKAGETFVPVASRPIQDELGFEIMAQARALATPPLERLVAAEAGEGGGEGLTQRQVHLVRFLHDVERTLDLYLQQPRAARADGLTLPGASVRKALQFLRVIRSAADREPVLRALRAWWAGRANPEDQRKLAEWLDALRKETAPRRVEIAPGRTAKAVAEAEPFTLRLADLPAAQEAIRRVGRWLLDRGIPSYLAPHERSELYLFVRRPTGLLTRSQATPEARQVWKLQEELVAAARRGDVAAMTRVAEELRRASTPPPAGT